MTAWFALMLCRAFGFSTTNSAASFPDVQPGTTYAGAIATAKTMGIVNGSPDGLFHANSPISRQEAMAMICRGMQAAGRNVPLVPTNTLSGYADNAQVAEFAKGNIASLLQLGVVRGNGGYLQPRNAITRAEMAVILHRVLTL